MIIVGKLSKMVVTPTSPISYELPLGETKIPLNPLLGQNILLRFIQKIHCIGCAIEIKKSYQGGYCFPCTQKLAQCDLCIVKPERCHFHLGTCREPEWGHSYCMIPHVVYLANASGIKVGITRKTQIPTRWIDQGAIEALALFEVPTRRVSGLVEIKLAQSISDKTNWRKMLTNTIAPVDLLQYRQTFLDKMENTLAEIYAQFGNDAVKSIAQPEIIQLNYPVLEYPKKIVSLSFDKTPEIEGKLLGIKGQYLLFDKGVINIRKYAGYNIELNAPFAKREAAP